MKKTFLCILCFSGFLVSSSLAQTSQGSILLGGNLGFYSHRATQKNDFGTFKGQSNNFNISPSVGFFISDQVAVGSSVSLFGSVSKNNSKVTGKGTGFSVAHFLRYYKLLGEKAALFGNAAVYYSRLTNNVLNAQKEFFKDNRQINYGASITPGLTYFVSPKFGIEATLGSIGFGKNTQEFMLDTSRPDNTDTNFQANFGLHFSSIGLRFYLTR